MGKKESRTVLASDHSSIGVGDKIVLETIGKKSPRMTIEEVATRVEEVAIRVEQVAMRVEELAQIVYDGFTKVNVRIDKFELDINSRIDNLIVKNNLKE